MITLQAALRDVKVKPKAIRKEGKLPAVCYGPGRESFAVSVDLIPFMKAFTSAGESTVISLALPKETLDVIIHDVMFEPVRGGAIHADFYIVAKDRVVEVEVPIEFVGEAPAVKLGGVVVRVLHELPIRALPGKLPAHFTVDLSKLETLDAHISVGDLALPEGVEALLDPEEVIASVTGQTEEPEAPAAPIDLSQIEVAKKGKKEEEEAPAA